MPWCWVAVVCAMWLSTKATSTSIQTNERSRSHLCSSTLACTVVQTKITCGGVTSISQSDVQDSGTYNKYTYAVVEEGVERLENRAFAGCSSISTVILPSSLEFIGELCFQSTILEYIDIGAKVSEIGGCFMNVVRSLKGVRVASGNEYYCNDTQGVLYNKRKTILHTYPMSATSITIPETVETINENAFAYGNIIDVVLPDSVKTVLRRAFYCSNIKTLHIGAGLSSWHDEAVSDCDDMETITMNSENENFYLLTTTKQNGYWGRKYSTGERSVLFIPPKSGYTEIILNAKVNQTGSVVLQSVSTATKLTLKGTDAGSTPDGQVLVKKKKIKGCVGGAVIVDMSTTEWSGVTVTQIDPDGFRGCAKLEKITFASTITTIGAYAFHSCSSMTTIDFNGAQITKMETITFSGAGLTSITFPSSLTALDKSQQMRNTKITSIDLPGITIVGESCFQGCKLLRTVKLPDCQTIRTKAFTQCTVLETVDFSNNRVLEQVGSLSFSYCDSLKSLNFPKTVKGLRASAVSYNPLLTSITFDIGTGQCDYKSVDGVVYTKDGIILVVCPSGYVNLTLESSTRIVESQAFYGCSKLFTVLMNDQLERVNESAFFDCPLIEMIRLPSKVSYIGKSAFDSCERLRKILYCNNRDCPVFEGNPFPTDPDIYTFASYQPPDGTFCGHPCHKILDDYCQIPTNYFTILDDTLYMSERIAVYLFGAAVFDALYIT